VHPFDFWDTCPIAPDVAVHPVAPLCRQARKRRDEASYIDGKDRIELHHRFEVLATNGPWTGGGHMTADVKALRLIFACRGGRERRVGKDPRCCPEALPIRNRTAGGRYDKKFIENTLRTIERSVIVTCGDDDRLVHIWEIPEPGERRFIPLALHHENEIPEQALHFVSLRNRRFSQVEIVRIKQITGPNDRIPVAVLPRPCWIALARIDDGPREVESKSCRAARADAAQGYCRVGRGSDRVRVKCGHGARAAQCVEVRATVELDSRGGDARAGWPLDIDPDILVSHRAGHSGDTE